MQNFIKIQLQYLNLKCKSIYNCTEIYRLVNNELWKLYFVKIVRYIYHLWKKYQNSLIFHLQVERICSFPFKSGV